MGLTQKEADALAEARKIDENHLLYKIITPNNFLYYFFNVILLVCVAGVAVMPFLKTSTPFDVISLFVLIALFSLFKLAGYHFIIIKKLQQRIDDLEAKILGIR